jgi:predicted esterase
MKKSFNLPLTYPQDFYTNDLKDYDRILLALHGYQLNGEFIFKRLTRHLNLKSTLLLCPNAPFLVPIKKGEDFHAGYSWYFFEPKTRNFYINYEPSAKLMCEFVNQNNPNKVPVDIIGYSQGGYLSPKIAELCSETEKVIGLSCIFRRNRFLIKENCEYIQIHGNKDQTVNYDEAKEEFEHLGLDSNNFHKVATEHLLDTKLLEKLKEIYE